MGVVLDACKLPDNPMSSGLTDCGRIRRPPVRKADEHMLGLGTLAKKVFGSPNDRKVKATRPIVDKINALEPEFEKLTDTQIVEKTAELRNRALNGESLDELLPDWRTMDCPMVQTPVTDNWHWMLTKGGSWNMPHAFMPPLMSNHGCYTGSLGNLCRWLAEQAEADAPPVRIDAPSKPIG